MTPAHQKEIQLTSPLQHSTSGSTSQSDQAQQGPVLVDHGYSEVKQVCSILKLMSTVVQL